MEEKIKTINNVLDELRPFLINDGGDIEFIKYDNNIVYIIFKGACSNCHMRDFTLKESIEKSLKEALPEIEEVKLFSEEF